MRAIPQKPAEPSNKRLHEQDLRWFAVHTRSKSEKFVQRALEKKVSMPGYRFKKLMRRYSRSIRMVEKPLINCYVFVKINTAGYLPVLETAHVAGFVKFNKTLLCIPESEMDLLRRITLETDLDVEAVPGSFAEGDPVEIAAGNLTGMRGRIVKVEGKRKMQVELTHLGYSLLITVDRAFLEKTGTE